MTDVAPVDLTEDGTISTSTSTHPRSSDHMHAVVNLIERPTRCERHEMTKDKKRKRPHEPLSTPSKQENESQSPVESRPVFKIPLLHTPDSRNETQAPKQYHRSGRRRRATDEIISIDDDGPDQNLTRPPRKKRLRRFHLFLQLPPELRNYVYALLLTTPPKHPIELPSLSGAYGRRRAREWAKCDTAAKRRRHKTIFLEILQASKQMYEEASAVLWSCNVFKYRCEAFHASASDSVLSGTRETYHPAFTSTFASSSSNNVGGVNNDEDDEDNDSNEKTNDNGIINVENYTPRFATTATSTNTQKSSPWISDIRKLLHFAPQHLPFLKHVKLAIMTHSSRVPSLSSCDGQKIAEQIRCFSPLYTNIPIHLDTLELTWYAWEEFVIDIPSAADAFFVAPAGQSLEQAAFGDKLRVPKTNAERDLVTMKPITEAMLRVNVKRKVSISMLGNARMTRRMHRLLEEKVTAWKVEITRSVTLGEGMMGGEENDDDAEDGGQGAGGGAGTVS